MVRVALSEAGGELPPFLGSWQAVGFGEEEKTLKSTPPISTNSIVTRWNSSKQREHVNRVWNRERGEFRRSKRHVFL